MNTVDGIDITTYGLRLARIEGHLDLPRYKNLIPINDLTAIMRITDERRIKVKLIGEFASTAAMVTAIENFKTKIAGAVKYTWAFSGHGFSETCFIKDPARIQVYRRPAVEIEFTLNVTV